MAKIYKQKFRREWLDDPLFKDWLIVAESTEGPKPKCTLCNSYIMCRFASIKQHLESKKHEANAKIVFAPKQTKLSFQKSSEIVEAKRAECKLALYVVQHATIRAIDHLTCLCKESFKGCSAANSLQMHRTKCSNVIKNVLAPHFNEDLDIGDSPYSIIIDESTDISVQKFLGIIIIYYSDRYNKIVTSFLGMPPLTECNAEAIVAAIKTTLQKQKLKIQKLMGIGTDNASVMVGINNAVFAKLKADVSHLTLVRCVCHSLQLAVSAAAKDTLPRHLEFLIRETYDWFCKSSLRQDHYKNLYRAINEGHDPLKIVQSCQTRWLSIETAVSRIVDQWIELKTHFDIARNAERCYTAENLYALFKDDQNYAYLCFLRKTLMDVQATNKLFEGNNVDPTKLYNELVLLIETLVSKIKVPHIRVDVFEEGGLQSLAANIDNTCYLGYGFEQSVAEMKKSHLLPQGAEETLRKRAIDFTLVLIKQLVSRVPENLRLLRTISNLSVENALKHNKPALIELLRFYGKSNAEIDIIENLWSKIHLIKWINVNNTIEFWLEVRSFKDAGNNSTFKELAEFAISLLTLPHSNAEVERLFSQMNLVKTKLRNRMNPDMVSALLTIRSGLRRHGKCCSDYEVPVDVINKIKTLGTHQAADNDEQADFDIFLE